MKEEQLEIIDIISEIWINKPELRFGQLLTALNILEFANKDTPSDSNYNTRDIFSDSDKTTLKRIKTSNMYIEHKKDNN